MDQPVPEEVQQRLKAIADRIRRPYEEVLAEVRISVSAAIAETEHGTGVVNAYFAAWRTSSC